MALLVAKKGTQIVHVFRRKGIKFHKEVLYKKHVKTAHPVVAMVSASREKDGFTGFIGLCEGHPKLSDDTSAGVCTFMPLKHPCDPELTKWFNQTVKPEWTKEDLFRELNTCPEIIALNTNETLGLCDGPSDDTALVSFEPEVQSPKPSFDSQSSMEDEEMVMFFNDEHHNHEVETGTKRKERENTPIGPTKGKNPPVKRAKHHPAIVTPTQELLVKKSCKNGVMRASVRVTRRDDNKLTGVPSTPERANARKTPRTPKGKMSTKVCNHEKWVDFQHWNSAYYQPRYMEGRMGKYYPKICKKCDKTFVSKSKTDSTFDPQNEFKVTCNQVVHVCPNATKDNHCCSYAVCQDCHSQFVKEIRYVISLATLHVPPIEYLTCAFFL
jgi:hypothetical protein